MPVVGDTLAAADPLRGVAGDAARIEALLAGIDGPIVLVGHSHGGNVISAARFMAKRAHARVRVAEGVSHLRR